MSSTGSTDVSGGGFVAAPPAATGLGMVVGGHYRLDAVAGRGGMATVYRAHDLQHGRPVAVKVLDAARLSAVDAARFQGEIDVLARLQHPHVLPLLDSGTIDGARFLVTPFVAGESLGRRLAREQRLELRDAVRLARQVASALAHAHALGVVHRDITPGNILLSNGLAVVADFGIARLAEPAAGAVTESGVTIGTPAYMSPEQASGDAALDARSDVYALGCVLYAMLTGAPPFAELPVQQSLTRRMMQAPEPPSGRRAEIPPSLDGVVLRALAPLQEDRWATADAFDAALAGIEAELASAGRATTTRLAAPRATPTPSAAPTASRALVAGGLLALVGSGAWLVARGAGTPTLDAAAIGVAASATDSTALALRDAIERWRDVTVRPVDALPATPEARQLADAPMTYGVGATAWARLIRDAEGRPAVQVDAARRDGAQVVVARGVVPLVALSLRDATRLALDSALGVAVPAGDRGAASLAAQRAYADGRRALQRWAMDTAVRTLRAAVAADSGWAGAQLALTQALVWLGDSTRAEARDAAERMAGMVPRLSSRSVAAGQAIVAMGRGDFPQACQQYGALVNADSTDATAWLGLALCQQRDSTVVPSAASPSGAAFRSSWWQAVQAMKRALALDPYAHRVFGFTWLTRRLLPINGSSLRPGVARGGALYAAFPSGEGDTVAFVPWTYEALGSPAATRLLPAVAIAHEANRRRVLEIARDVQRLAPQSADANESLALALESVGELAAGGLDPRTSIDSVVAAARQATRSPGQRLRLGSLEVRIALKRGRFGDARRLADSIVAAPLDVRSRASLRLRSALLALTGRMGESAALAELVSDGDPQVAQDTPLTLRHAVARLLTYAAFGARDSIRTTHQTVSAEMARWVSPARRGAWSDRHLAQAALLAAHPLGAMPDWSPQLQQLALGRLLDASLRSDTAAVARLAASMQAQRASARPGDVSLDAVLVEAQSLARVGLTAAATTLIDQALDALPARDVVLLDVPTSASLVRLMQLRASVAPGSPESVRWGAAADTLWGPVSRR